MTYHFYLSYAPADYTEELRKFFEDLSFAICARLRLSEGEPVGFFDPRGNAARSDWSSDVAEALRTSQTMVALISPEYLRCESSGKEWKIFERRRRLAAGLGSAEATSTIAPVIWIPCADNIPKVVSDRLDSLGHLNAVYRQNAMPTARNALGSSRDEYVRTLMTLAEHIVGLALTAELPPLDSLPPLDEVENALRPPLRESSLSFTDVAENGKKCKVVVIEGHQQVREMLVEYLISCNFEVEDFEEAGQVPFRMLRDESQTSPPDLFVVDLEFENTARKEGLDLIKKIKAIKSRPGVMAMSASLSNESLIEAMTMGAEDVVPKPFDMLEIVKRMKKLADIGKKRRLNPQGRSRSPVDSIDPDRKDRQVFLSYSTADNYDNSVAIFLKSNLEARDIKVWYSEEMLGPDDPEAVNKAFDAIAKAQVFLPLITDKYPSSAPCFAELHHFCTHKEMDGSRVMMPVLHGLPKDIKNFEWIRPFLGEHRNLSLERFLDDLIALLGWIQKTVKRKPLTPAEFKDSKP